MDPIQTQAEITAQNLKNVGFGTEILMLIQIVSTIYKLWSACAAAPTSIPGLDPLPPDGTIDATLTCAPQHILSICYTPETNEFSQPVFRRARHQVVRACRQHDMPYDNDTIDRMTYQCLCDVKSAPPDTIVAACTAYADFTL
jgi:hypothetical protein